MQFTSGVDGDEGQGLRIKFGVFQDVDQVVGIEGAFEAFGFHAAFHCGILFQQAQSQASHRRQVGGTVSILLSPCVFGERNIENPVLAVLDAPMFANGNRQRLRAGRMTADV